MSDDTNKLTADTESEPMWISRRKILQVSGAIIVAGGAFASTAAADDHLINVSATAIELDCDNGDTGTFTIGIEGPPFGRTDVTVEGTNASPTSFRLAGDEASQTITVGPIAEDENVTIEATTPRGESQTATVAVTCKEDEENSLSVSDPTYHESHPGCGGNEACIVTFSNNSGGRLHIAEGWRVDGTSNRRISELDAGDIRDSIYCSQHFGVEVTWIARDGSGIGPIVAEGTFVVCDE